ncbi:odorant receptor 131-2-like [Leuresthes tenuis]|uniref:odorant receptor 131-2-like n=1 Tax=Leuresthes tenuis TaxID=355514 RepID=UPI003B502DBC
MNVSTTISRDSQGIAILKNAITVVLTLSVIYINGTLVHTFRKHQIFNMNPRYILYIHLVINDIIMLLLYVVLQVLSYILFTLHVSFCLIMLMIAIVSSLNNPLTLAAMAAECYLAICFPLHHPRICTVKKTYITIAVIWTLSSLTIIPDLFVVLATKPMDFFTTRIFCLRARIFTNPELHEKQEISNILFLVFVWVSLFYTYFRILFAAQAASTNAKKARNTVLLHGFQLLLCMLSYVHSLTIEGLSKFFPKDSLIIRYIVSILIQILPRLVSPVVYGLRDKTFRKYLKNYYKKKEKIHP